MTFKGIRMTRNKRYAPLNADIRQRILARDHDRCVYCRGRGIFVDHVIPACNPASTADDSNLVTACLECNNFAAGQTFESLDEKKKFVRAKRLAEKFLIRCRFCAAHFVPKVWWQQFCKNACSAGWHVERHWSRKFGLDLRK